MKPLIPSLLQESKNEDENTSRQRETINSFFPTVIEIRIKTLRNANKKSCNKLRKGFRTGEKQVRACLGSTLSDAAPRRSCILGSAEEPRGWRRNASLSLSAPFPKLPEREKCVLDLKGSPQENSLFVSRN